MATQTSRSMVSETSICNQALAFLGATQVESLQEPSRNAEYCRNNYPFVRDAVLEDGTWSFARVRKVEGPSAEIPEWDENMYLQPIPVDWLAVREVTDESKCEVNWAVEDGQIITEVATVVLTGVRRVVDTGKFTPLFVQALAARLAYVLAIPITGKTSVMERMWALYETQITNAQNADRQQKRKPRFRDSRMVDVRDAGVVRVW